MSQINRQWRLRSRPMGMVKESDFQLAEVPVPALGPDQILVQNTHLAFEPAMRGWMEDRPSYIAPVAIGEVMRGMTVGQVLESNLEGYQPGDRVTGMTGWQEFAVGDRGLGKLPDGVTPEMALSLFGVTGITAYFGLLDIGEPKEAETVVVSGAAGATGSIAGQIARIKGCRVIGIAGGSHKCEWLLDEARFDGAIDYKHENVGERLSDFCPNGIDIFFDNVGGPILDDVLARITQKARVVLCGGISHYNDERGPSGPKNYFNLVLQRGRMEGFIVTDYLPRWGEAIAQLGAWAAEGQLAWRVDVQEGFENAPRTFLRLFEGANVGKQLLKFCDAPITA